MKALTIVFAVLFTFTFMSLTYAANEKPLSVEARQEFNELKNNAKVKIKAAEEKIAQWKKQALDSSTELSADARKVINNNIAQLEVLSEDLEDKLEDLEDASADKWIDAKTSFRNSMNKLEAEYKKMTN